MRNRLLLTLTLLLACIGLAACADVSASLPARPTAVATLARLPSVTPVTPRPTAPPTPTLVVIVTPTPGLLLGAVAVAANVRAGPGVEFGIVGVLDAGAQVILERRQGEWYAIRGPNDVSGWMAGQVLEIDAEINAAVPQAAP